VVRSFVTLPAWARISMDRRLGLAILVLLAACAAPPTYPSPASRCYRLVIRPGRPDSSVAYFGLTNSPLPDDPHAYLALAQAGPDSSSSPGLTGVGAWYLSGPAQITIVWPYLTPPAFAFSGTTFVLGLAQPPAPMVGALGGWTDDGLPQPSGSLLAWPAPCSRPVPDPAAS
jgi:hypothetical protein